MSSEDPGEYAHFRKLAWAFVARHCFIYWNLMYMYYYTYAKKRRQPWAMYKLRLGVTYRPTPCRWSPSPTCLQVNQTVGNNFLFQQDNASIPAICQRTVCKLVISYPLDWPSGSWSISDRPPLGNYRAADTCFPNLNSSWLNNGNVFHEGGGVTTQCFFWACAKAS